MFAKCCTVCEKKNPENELVIESPNGGGGRPASANETQVYRKASVKQAVAAFDRGVPEEPKVELTLGEGAYLLYTPNNDGVFYQAWLKSPEAVATVRADGKDSEIIAYAKPGEGITVPAHKYRGSSELLCNVHKLRNGLAVAILQFLKTVKPYNSLVVLMEQNEQLLRGRLHGATVFVHQLNNVVSEVAHGNEALHLKKIDAAVAILTGSEGHNDFRSLKKSETVSFAAFQTRAKQNADCAEFVSLASR